MVYQDEIDYSKITESPGLKATAEQVERLYQRYKFAKGLAAGKEILEVACGSGMGLGYLAEKAKTVIGGDIDEKNVALARERSKEVEKQRGKEVEGQRCKEVRGKDVEKERSKDVKKQRSKEIKKEIRVELMDAQNISLPDRSVDLVILFEAIYYLHSPGKFVSEAKRVLRDDGRLVICTVNKDWEDFHPSPYTHKYFSVPELRGIIKDKFEEIKFYGGFPVEKGGVRDAFVSFIKRTALKFNLIPGSLKARAYLKRIFMGELKPLPERIYEGMAEYEEPVEIDGDEVCRGYKIVYVVAEK